MDKNIRDSDFPELLYLMNGYLYEQADSFEALLHGYVIANGQPKAQEVIHEIDELLELEYPDEEITRFVNENCLYLENDSGRATLELIRKTLTQLVTKT